MAKFAYEAVWFCRWSQAEVRHEEGHTQTDTPTNKCMPTREREREREELKSSNPIEPERSILSFTENALHCVTSFFFHCFAPKKKRRFFSKGR